jgi:hypothetical protein
LAITFLATLWRYIFIVRIGWDYSPAYLKIATIALLAPFVVQTSFDSVEWLEEIYHCKRCRALRSCHQMLALHQSQKRISTEALRVRL